MAKILFTHSYFLQFDPKQWELQQPYAPLGTLYAAALIRSNNFEVALHDTMFCKQADELIAPLKAFNPDWLVIYDDGFNYLTKMCLSNMRDAAYDMIRIAKTAGCKVAVSSSDSTDNYVEYLAVGADVVLLGEAEKTLEELLLLDEKKLDWQHIKGIAYQHDNEVKKNTKREVLKNLDDLPYPAWDLVKMTAYKNAWLNSTGYFSINMGTTRGCPFKCNWCAKPIYGNRYNSRSPENVVAELLMLKNLYQYNHVWFCDDIFGLKPQWVNQFANELKKHNLSFEFKIQSRVDLLLENQQIEDLARAGCTNVWVGAESGSQKILDAMDKGTQVAQIYEATRLLKKHHIKPAFFIQFGYPGENMDDILKTINMINDLLPEDIGVSISYPLPGTLFYENVKSQLKQKTHWTDSDDLTLMFKNSYSANFYKQLHRYVHKNYRKHQALDAIINLIKKPTLQKIKTIRRAGSYLYYVPATIIEKNKLMRLQND